ncbi:MAG: Fic family protein [Bacteroidia bacterium]
MQLLPFDIELETKTVLKRLPAAHAALAELKGLASTIPNQHILINTLALKEARDSSAIENIITTHDDLFKAEIDLESSVAAKEVQHYITALRRGFELISEHGLLTNKIILQIQEVLEQNNAGFRRLPGTNLKNAATGEIIYTPPQSYEEIVRLMANLERYINDDSQSNIDPLIKMAVIHWQFEGIHPFYDGNGRTGRIINILYLILKELQQLPILYLSQYIIRHKPSYYHLLQQVRETGEWEGWILYMLDAVEETSRTTISLIRQIRILMQRYKETLRNQYKFYSQDLLNSLFKHPYTKIDFLASDLNVSRITASSYLNTLAKDGLLKKKKLGRANYYVNEDLFTLLSER